MDKMRWFIIGNLLGLSLLLAGIAIKENFKTSQEKSSSEHSLRAASENLENVQRVTVKHHISKGFVLSANDVELHFVEKRRVPPDAIVNVNDALGKVTKTDLVEGEIVKDSDLSSHI
jgi:flagella basal body P-ring formation protein FlgA